MLHFVKDEGRKKKKKKTLGVGKRWEKPEYNRIIITVQKDIVPKANK